MEEIDQRDSTEVELVKFGEHLKVRDESGGITDDFGASLLVDWQVEFMKQGVLEENGGRWQFSFGHEQFEIPVVYYELVGDISLDFRRVLKAEYTDFCFIKSRNWIK